MKRNTPPKLHNFKSKENQNDNSDNHIVSEIDIHTRTYVENGRMCVRGTRYSVKTMEMFNENVSAQYLTVRQILSVALKKSIFTM